MRIALDAMGGDHAPREIILGAAEGLNKAPDAEIVLYGPKERIEAECSAVGLRDDRISIRDCREIVEMDDSPVDAIRQKRDSSMVRMAVDAGKGEVDAVISAGNTGAFAAACHFKVGVLKGVSRPGIAVTLPSFHGPVVVCDVGANVAPKPHHLHEYAHMSVSYARLILGVQEPKIGLVSIGEEDVKGNSLVKDAHNLLRRDPALKFHGNVEGRDIFAGECDVFVCDGFVGNVILKLTEGLADGIFNTIRKEISEDSPHLVKQFEPVVERIWARHDFAEYGGAPLMGVNGVAIICHGRSDRRAIGNAVRVSAELVRARLNSVIVEQLSRFVETPA
ncbi:MAG: Phosphate acyltransferase [Phycisphaerae bacterium]|nr:Phosphate acyltransferase [Phycisphaerae bacterium]